MHDRPLIEKYIWSVSCKVQQLGESILHVQGSVLDDLREHFHSYDAHWLNMQSSTSATPLSVVRIRKPLFDSWGCDDLSLNINALDDFQSKIVKLFIDDDNAILDTDGTVPLTPCHLDAIRCADALVRISMDSANPATEGCLRPRRGVA